ncbi:MAG: SPOR domain-containing protein [candidate division Zixibacteria bacterium]|nr:SPOR domain-containing protein [candidate division Zixibacteria bacterium]
MRCLLITSLTLILSLVTSAQSETIYTLILKGRLVEARDSLSLQTSAATRDGNTLFYQSLLEPDAEQSVRLMKAALKATLQSHHREEIMYRLAQYNLLQGNYGELSQLVAEYQSRWETGRYSAAMRRLSVLVDELQQGYESALRQCDRFLVRYTDRDYQHWGLIDKARILAGYGKRIGADKTLRQLSRARKGVGVSPALYLLCRDAIKRNRADDAIFYYNILREGYPSAVGIDYLMSGLGDMSSRTPSNNKAEKLTGTFYSVKVGVFSEPGNARRQADKFRGYDKHVEIKARDISGRKYRVVYVGHFDDYEEALRFRLQLEDTHQEAYQVVAR